MRAQTPSPTALTAYTPTPHGPYCLHSLLYIESSYRPPMHVRFPHGPYCLHSLL